MVSHGGNHSLPGGRTTPGIIRIGDTVRRPLHRDLSFAHQCLLHLECIGFSSTPKFLSIYEHGREVLSLVPGFVPADLRFYTDGQLTAAAALLRRFHDATATMASVMNSGFEVACHNDWAPTNTVFAGEEPVALIDFDTAAPGDRLWDLGYSAFTWLDLGNNDYAPDEQIRRLNVFAAGYDHSGCTAPRIAVNAVLARRSWPFRPAREASST